MNISITLSTLGVMVDSVWWRGEEGITKAKQLKCAVRAVRGYEHNWILPINPDPT